MRSFLEILSLEKAKSGPYQKMKELICGYEAKRDLVDEMFLDRTFLRERELKYYMCSLFAHYWLRRDLDNFLNPSFGTSEAITRAYVAEAQGRQAIEMIVEFIYVAGLQPGWI